MGAYWASRPGRSGRTLPHYLDKWLPGKFELMVGWEGRSRSSGGFEGVRAIGIHHDASSIDASLVGTFNYCVYNSSDRPIGNGSGTRTKHGPKFRLWAAGASNTQGRGGPVLTSRGVIPLNDGNRWMFSIEWMNNGVGETWDDDECVLYLLVVCAVMDWASSETPGPALTPGDVFAHFEWTNPNDPYGSTRKIDPFGPCRWNDHQNRKWDMGRFRRDLGARWLAGPPGSPPPFNLPPHTNTEDIDMKFEGMWYQAGTNFDYAVYSDRKVAMTSADHYNAVIALETIRGRASDPAALGPKRAFPSRALCQAMGFVDPGPNDDIRHAGTDPWGWKG